MKCAIKALSSVQTKFYPVDMRLEKMSLPDATEYQNPGTGGKGNLCLGGIDSTVQDEN